MAWVFLALASFGEIVAVMSLNLYVRRKTLLRLTLTGITFGLALLFLSLAMREIPMSIAYAIWTGLGAAGAVLMGILFFREPADWKRLFFLGCIIVGAAGLKWMS